MFAGYISPCAICWLRPPGAMRSARPGSRSGVTCHGESGFLGGLDVEVNVPLGVVPADALQKMGYTIVISLDGGWRAYKDSRLPCG